MSQLMLACFLFFLYHYHHPHHCHLPATSLHHPATSPSPLLRDVGSSNITPAPSEVRMQLPPPLPSSKGCGWLGLTRGRNEWARGAKGDLGGGRPSRRNINESANDDGNTNPREDNNTNASNDTLCPNNDSNTNPREDNDMNARNDMSCPNQHPSIHAQAADTRAQEFQLCRLGEIEVKVRTAKEGPEGRGEEAPDNEEQKMRDQEEEKEAPDEEEQMRGRRRKTRKSGGGGNYTETGEMMTRRNEGNMMTTMGKVN